MSISELQSMAMRRRWGPAKMTRLHEAMAKIPAHPIEDDALVTRWAEIDAYRQNALEGRPLPVGQPGFQMGDNDLWIAATAPILNATLITTDRDFLPLHEVFLKVVYVDRTQS